MVGRSVAVGFVGVTKRVGVAVARVGVTQRVAVAVTRVTVGCGVFVTGGFVGVLLGTGVFGAGSPFDEVLVAWGTNPGLAGVKVGKAVGSCTKIEEGSVPCAEAGT